MPKPTTESVRQQARLVATQWIVITLLAEMLRRTRDADRASKDLVRDAKRAGDVMPVPRFGDAALSDLYSQEFAETVGYVVTSASLLARHPKGPPKKRPQTREGLA